MSSVTTSQYFAHASIVENGPYPRKPANMQPMIKCRRSIRRTAAVVVLKYFSAMSFMKASFAARLPPSGRAAMNSS